MSNKADNWLKHTYRQLDPFSEDIEPALLNSEHISMYVEKGCLIAESDFDPDRLMPASYALRFLGELHYWQDDQRENNPTETLNRCREVVSKGDTVKLRRNSITYFWTQEKLLIPEYIAARFNLYVRHVHRGILLGAGPLVDPGFAGNILVPLHNLTNNEYELTGGDILIWVEFTKLSRSKVWSGQQLGHRPDRLKEFPREKLLQHPNKYFENAGVLGAGGVQSAFKGALRRAQKDAEEARKDAEEARKAVRNFGALAGAVALVSIIGVIVAGYNLISNSVDRVQEAHNKIFVQRLEDQGVRIGELEEVLRRSNEISREETAPNEESQQLGSGSLPTGQRE